MINRAPASRQDERGESSLFGAKRLYRDAGSIASATIASGVLGMLFWAVAAKLSPPAQLGVMTAVLSVITTTGSVIASGVGSAYSALIPAVGAARVKVYRRGQRTCLVLSSIAGVVVGAGTITLLTQVRGSVLVGIVVGVGVIVWALWTLQSSALSSIGRARWLPFASVAMSTAKIVLLIPLAYIFSAHSVELATVGSVAAGVLVLAPLIRRVLHSSKGLPLATDLSEQEALSEFNRFVPWSLMAVALSFGVFGVAPFLVTFYAGPSQGALFALAASIVLVLELIGQSLGYSLTVHASGTPDEASGMARSVMLRAVAIMAVGSVVLTACVPTALRLLNAQYGSMKSTEVVAVLCAGTVVNTGYMVWSALQRARRRMTPVVVLNFVAAVAFLAMCSPLIQAHGALGGGLAWLYAEGILSAGAAAHIVYGRRSRRGR